MADSSVPNSANAGQQPPTATAAAKSSGSAVETDSLYMDAEETELLHRFSTDNPNMVSFADTDDRIRTLEERFPESELEKILLKANNLLAKRREAMIGDERVQPLPIHPHVPTMLQLRDLRNEMVSLNAQYSTHESFVNLADVLAKEVALSEESRANVPYALATLVDFYKEEIERLPRKLTKYLQRYEQLSGRDSECALTFRSSFEDRLTKLTDQLVFARHAYQAVSTFADLYNAEAKMGTARGPGGLGGETSEDQKYAAQAANARLVEELHPLFFRYYISDQAYEYRISRRIERFVSRAQLTPLLKRYDLYAAAIGHLIGGQPAIGAEVQQTVPILTKQDTVLSDQLDHLCSCFRIPQAESTSDLQQFAYNVNRKYQIVFASQNDEWLFVDDSGSFGAASTSGKAKGEVDNEKRSKGAAGSSSTKEGTTAASNQTNADGSGLATVLRNSGWTSLIKNIDPAGPAWQAQQDIAVAAVPLTTEGGQLLVAEMTYIKETSVQHSVDRWKLRTESFHKRMQHRRGFALQFAGDGDAESAVGDLPAIHKLINANTTLQKYYAIQQLRFIRAREFRRKLLETLNYFASVLRMIAQDSSATRTLSHSFTNVAGVTIPPIRADRGVERDRSLLKPVITKDDPLRFVECDSFATQMLRVMDGVSLELEADDLTVNSSSKGEGGISRKKSTADSDSIAAQQAKAHGASSSISHLDIIEVTDGKLIVKRASDGAPVVDQWALDELKRVEDWITKLGTFFVTRFNQETYPNADGSMPATSSSTNTNNAAASPTSPNRAASPVSPTSAAEAAGTIDYSVVVEDLLEAESWFCEGKMKVLNDYREAYEHSTDSTQSYHLAKEMITLIRRRPRIDFTDSYFSASYTREVVNLELQHSMLREVIQSQIVEERRIMSNMAPVIPASAINSSNTANTTGGQENRETKQRSGSLHPGSKNAPSTAAGGAGGTNAPSLSGLRTKPTDTLEFPAAIQRSMSSSNVDPKAFGLPDSCINDPRLYFSLFAGSTVVNQLDMYRSLGLIAYLPGIVERACAQIAERFNIKEYPSVYQILEREVLQELLVQWRLLGEEDKLSRQMQQSSVSEIDADASTAVIHDIKHIDAIIDELLSEEDITSRKRNNLAGPVGSKDPLASNSDASPAPAGVLGLGSSRNLPPLAPLCVQYINVMDIFHVRSAILTSLYDTELLYSVHRRQGRIMGLSVKKSQLGPIDFETRRTFAEVDDLEAFKDTSNPLEEILSIKTELLSSLSIGEFDAQMAAFDLQSYDGVRRLISHAAKDFRAALTSQVCTKNMLIAVTHCNMVAIDVYFENVYKQTYERALKSMTNFQYPMTNASQAQPTRCRLRSWPGVTALIDNSSVDAASGTATVLDRNQLSKYFISVNTIKSVFRKSILNEMSNRTSDIMSSKKPETLRKVLKELKGQLVREYCVAVTMATYQLAVKYHTCTLALQLRKFVLDFPQLNFFTLGSATDVIRPAPRGMATGGESRRAATCLITRNGRLDEPRYIPNVLQILAMDYQSKDMTRTAAPGSASSGVNANVNASGGSTAGGGHSGVSGSACIVLPNLSGSTNYLRSNVLLSFTARILYHWTALMRLLHTVSMISPALRNAQHLSEHHEDTEKISRGALIEHWKGELVIIANELESLRDPNDSVSVIEFLEGKHAIYFLKLMASIANGKSYAERYQYKNTIRKLRFAFELFDDHTRFLYATRVRFPRLLYPLVERCTNAIAHLPADERLRVSAYYAPVCGVKKLLDGAPIAHDFDQSLHEIEIMAATSIPLHRDEDTFYSELEKNNLRFIGDEVSTPMVALEWIERALTAEERNLLGIEMQKIDQLVEDSKDDTESLVPATLPRGTKAIKDVAMSEVNQSVVAHFEFMLHTARRDRLREVYFTLTTACLRFGWQSATKSQKALTATSASASTNSFDEAKVQNENTLAVTLDDMYARSILARGRVVCEKEAADKNDNRFRRKQKGNEKEVTKRQYQLLVMEVNKLLILKTRAEAEVVVKELESAAAQREALNAAASAPEGSLLAASLSGNALSFKTSVFTDFCRIVMARAMCTRPEGERLATFHIPESSLTLAIDTVGSRISEWYNEVATANTNIAEQCIRMLQKKVFALETKLQHESYMREVDSKAVERRTTAAVADRKYELLFANGVLEKQVAALKEQIRDSEAHLRETVRVEYQERISKLESDLMLNEQRFQAFRKKTFRDVQASLEEIKRGAMLAVGKMENAPLHMKRQALRIAISDDELNTLKEQNAELKQAILKTKIWYEIKGMRMKASFEKKLKDATKNMEESRAQFWDNKEATESEIKQLKTQLSAAQYQLSQAEIEIEMLRKDLQVQLSNKKDLVSWKLQNAKTMEELQTKLRKFEKWAAYDMDRIVAEYEKRQQQQSTTPSGAEAEERISPSKKYSSTRQGGSASSGRQGLASAAGSITLSVDEHKRLLEKIDREKKLKEQAFSKIDEMRMAEAGSTEALVWQRKYFEAANELQKHIKELEATRAFLVANGLTLPMSVSHPPSQAPVAGRGANSAAMSTRSAVSSSPAAFELRPSTSNAPMARPPASASSKGPETTTRQPSAASSIPSASRLTKK